MLIYLVISNILFFFAVLLILILIYMTRYTFQIIALEDFPIVSVPCSRSAHLQYLAYNSGCAPFTTSLDDWALKFLSPRSYDKVRKYILQGFPCRIVSSVK